MIERKAQGAVVDDELIEQVLSVPESRRFETKRVGGKHDRKLETILAFANTEGGVLVLGVEDSDKATARDRLFGVEENPESVDELERLVRTRFVPPLGPPDAVEPRFMRVACTLRDGTRGTVVLVNVAKSPTVHSFADDGTYVRLDRSNRQLTASEVTTLSLSRGTVSFVAQVVDVPFDLLNTDLLRAYIEARKLSRAFPEVLEQVGLAKRLEGQSRPTRAAVLLFADDPAGILNEKCCVRVFQYRGDRVEHGEATNLVRPPQTIRGPLLAQIRDATKAVIDALAAGLRVSPLGFEVAQRYPVRVLREAITNAVLHRDYFVDADIHIRIFDNRIEVDSPGGFPGSVTRENIGHVGSQPRNRQLVDHLREFPTPPNLDAGEGVPMMVALMEKSALYPPLYVSRAAAPGAVMVILLNEDMPSAWTQVESYLKKHSNIGNAEVRRLLKTDSALKASKQLKAWVEAGLLEIANPEAGKSVRRYRRAGDMAVERFLQFEIKNDGNDK
jgi:ATP-dependent DNA helicase RecG